MRTGLEASISQFVGHQKKYTITATLNNTDIDQARVIIDDVPSGKKSSSSSGARQEYVSPDQHSNATVLYSLSSDVSDGVLSGILTDRDYWLVEITLGEFAILSLSRV